MNPQKEDQTHAGFYASSALTYVLAMLSSNLALRWVPYPTQVIGKSAKPIPVMLLGVLVGRKSYALQRYFFVLLIVVGVVLFMMKEGHVSKTSDDNVGLGEILLILSLSMDGFTGAIQERMRAASAPSAQHMMLSMNAWSTIFVSVGIVASGELFEFIHFAGKYPQVWIQLAILALTGSLGQYFIFMMVNKLTEFTSPPSVVLSLFLLFFFVQVSAFGPLACSVVTTTRKFFTVLCSVLFLGNPLTSRQWLGTAIVFAGLFADACFGKSAPKKKSAKGSKSENEKLIS